MVELARNATRPLRAFTAGLGVETNTFSMLHVGMKDFERTFLYRPGKHPQALTEVSAPLHVLRQRRELQQWDVVEGTYAFALPAGRVERAAYEFLREEILAQLAAAMPVDLVALSLHGAMCAFDCDDCEGDLLARIRQMVGPTIPVGIEFDPHAHLSAAMVANSDIAIAYKENPHTDFLARGHELIDLLERCARTAWRPAIGVFDCRLIGRFHTRREPMKGFVQAMVAAEQRPEIASVSLVHGFPWGDVADMGAKCLVLADDQTAADSLATTLGEKLIAMREQTFTPAVPYREALAAALASPRGPVVLADVSDNPGSGAPGDATVLLEQILNDAVDACLGPLWDPAAVDQAHDAGIGGRFRVNLGGRSGAGPGSSLDLEVEVIGLAEQAWQTWAGTQMSLGRAAAVRSGPVSIIIASIRDQAYGPDLFLNLGVDPAAHRLIVVKSAQHFAAGFEKMASHIVLASGGGPLETDFRRIPYRHISRPMWPIDAI